jgi:hypothetical protein
VAPTVLWRSAAPDFSAARDTIRLPLFLPVRQSAALAAALTIAHLLVGIGLSLLRLPLPAKLAIWVVLSLSLSRAILLQRRRPVALKLQADGQMRMIDADGDEHECRIQADTTVMPWLVVLRYRTRGEVASLTLPVDALGSEGHRQLRSWLRWRASVDQA